MSSKDWIDEFLTRNIGGLPGNHASRVMRVAMNLEDDDPQKRARLLHLMSRVGDFSEGLAVDLRAGAISPEDTATLLELLADLGKLAFGEWSKHPGDSNPI